MGAAGIIAVVVGAVVVDQPLLEPPLTIDGAAMVGEDVAGDAEQPEPSSRVGQFAAATPGNREHLRGDVVGIGRGVAAPASEAPEVLEVSIEQPTEQVGV